MNAIAIILLFVTIVLELLSLLQRNYTLNAYTFALAYAGAGALLLAFALRMLDGPYRKGVALIGLGYLMRAPGELAWELNIWNDNTSYFVANSPYYITSLLYVLGAFIIYQAVAKLLNLGQRPLIFALIGAIGLAAFTGFFALDGGQMTLGFWAESLNNVVSAFAAFLMISVAALTRGGALSRWSQPLGAVFLLYLIGNTLYTLDADNYNYSTIPNYFWIAETLVVMLMTAFLDRNNLDDDDF